MAVSTIPSVKEAGFLAIMQWHLGNHICSLIKLWERDISKQGGMHEIYYPLETA